MIVGICGLPRKGKTALLTYFAIQCMTTNRRYTDCVNKIKELNAGGFKFSLPPQKHVVYTNYDVIYKSYDYGTKLSYKFNPYYMGMPNSQHPTLLLAPYADIFITEGQRPLNSRMSFRLSDFVSQFYETGGHIGYNFYIDCQRLNLLDANVRELMELVIEVQSITFKENHNGEVVKTIWHTKNFNSCFDYDLYLSSGKKKGGKSFKYVFNGDIKKYYNSFYCFPQYLKDSESRDFIYTLSHFVDNNVDSIKEFNDNNPNDVPSTYYKK